MDATRLARNLPLALAVALCSIPAPSWSQEAPVFDWQSGPLLGAMGGSLAEIDVPEGFVFLGEKDTASLLQLMENPVSGDELAIVAPRGEGVDWFLVFEWSPIGWVDDSEKETLDGDAMLASIQEGNRAANEERTKRGWAPLEIVGWQEPPHYDERTHNLTWGVTARSQGSEVVNRNVKVLGRHGVMTVTLVAGPDELAAAVPAADRLLEGFRFQAGNRYAEFIPGTDKVAEYGLTALVVGGAGAALLKSGLLARFWKVIVVAAAAGLAGLRRFFGGRKAPRADSPDPIV